MSDISIKEYMDRLFDERDKRVDLALAALKEASNRQRDNASFWISIMALGISLGSLYLASHK